MMLEAGRDVLSLLEPTLGFEGLTYSTVFAHLLEEHNQKVTIGSVHERLWKSQRDFQLDVVASALTDPVSGTVGLATAAAMRVVENADLTTPAGRRYATQSVTRVAAPSNINPVTPPSTKLIQAVRLRLWATGPDHPEAEGFFDTISKIREESTTAHAALTRAMMDIIGLRVRPEAGDPDQALRDIALLANAASIGVQTDVLGEARSERFLPTGPNGEIERWRPDGIAMWAIVQANLELDGDDLTAAERRL